MKRSPLNIIQTTFLPLIFLPLLEAVTANDLPFPVPDTLNLHNYDTVILSPFLQISTVLKILRSSLSDCHCKQVHKEYAPQSLSPKNQDIEYFLKSPN